MSDMMENLFKEKQRKGHLMWSTVPSTGEATPTGKKTITNTSETNVAEYATAQVVDSNLKPGNIKKDVVILGVTGTFSGGESGGK